MIALGNETRDETMMTETFWLMRVGGGRLYMLEWKPAYKTRSVMHDDNW